MPLVSKAEECNLLKNSVATVNVSLLAVVRVFRNVGLGL